MNELCQLLDWDTEFFGFRVARVNDHHLTPQSVSAIETWCQQQNITCLYFLAEMNDPQTTRLAETHDFRFVDLRLTFEIRPLPALQISNGLMVRLYQPDDLSTLMEVARVSYTDSRYYFDLCFPRAKCDALYETWIKQSCEGGADAVWVAEIDGQPAGFITCHIKNQTGEIGLVGVAEQMRGRSVGSSLVTQALHWFHSQGVGTVTVVTQGRNFGAQRLYQRCGFTTRTMQIWYHRWFNNKECDHG